LELAPAGDAGAAIRQNCWLNEDKVDHPALPDAAPTVGILTCSSAGEHAPCRTLARSVARFTGPDVLHRIVVPRRDLALFQELAGPRTEIIPQEALLPRGFMNLPRPPGFLARVLPALGDDISLTPVGLLRGARLRQIVKFAAAAAMPADIVIHADSDTCLLRPLDHAALRPGGRVRLYAVPGAGQLDANLPWHAAAADLLGLPPRQYFGADYVGLLKVWNPVAVQALLERVEAMARTPWQRAMARRWRFSEDILYGAYAGRSGLCPVPHAPTPLSLCHSSRGQDVRSPGGVARFVAGLEPHHLGAELPATEALDDAARAAILAALEARAVELLTAEPAGPAEPPAGP
jgi:hypothetical protein